MDLAYVATPPTGTVDEGYVVTSPTVVKASLIRWLEHQRQLSRGNAGVGEERP